VTDSGQCLESFQALLEEDDGQGMFELTQRARPVSVGVDSKDVGALDFEQVRDPIEHRGDLDVAESAGAALPAIGWRCSAPVVLPARERCRIGWLGFPRTPLPRSRSKRVEHLHRACSSKICALTTLLTSAM
jgi:hypothetical protein